MISFRYLQKILHKKVKLTKIDEENLSLIIYILISISMIESIIEGICFAIIITKLAEVII